MPDAHSWDERYRAGDHAESEPDPFLLRCSEYLDEFLPGRGRALDLAGGAGRNAVHLAALGFSVSVVDVSPVGLCKAEDLAASRGVSLHTVRADLERGEYLPPPDSFDLVIVFFFLERSLFPAIRSTLKPGGLVIYRTYTLDQPAAAGSARRPKHPMHLLRHNELLEQFAGLRILLYEETVREKGVAALVARKPPR